MEPLILTFGFDDDTETSVTPAHAPLAAVREFVTEVENFLRGDDKDVDTAALRIAVVQGSFALRTEPVVPVPKLVADLRLLGASNALDAMSLRRRDVVLAWQKRARGPKRLRYSIDAGLLIAQVCVTADTDFHTDDANEWVQVERYLRGEVLDLGGARNVNAHIRLPDGSSLQVDATRDQLRNERANRLYKPVMVRFTAEFNVRTNAYRAARLLSFSDYEPRYDERSLQRLTQRGAEAWADVADAVDWVEHLRED